MSELGKKPEDADQNQGIKSDTGNNTNKDAARGNLMLIREEIFRMGANDYEPGAVQEILDDFESDKIAPDLAIKKMNQILFSKQDYH